MDDKRFDDIIKDKVGQFEPEGFDPSALASLHYRMASEYNAPWYVKYRSEMLLGAASAIIAIILLWGQWGISNYNSDILQNQLAQLQSQNSELLAAKNQLSSAKPAADTIRIIEYKNDNATLYANLMAEMNALKEKVSRSNYEERSPQLADKQLLYLGRAGEVPFEVIGSLRKDHDIFRQGDYLFVVLDDELDTDKGPYIVRKRGIENSYILPEYEFVLDTTMSSRDQVIASIEKKPVQITVKQRREIEKHYQKGIGIELGPIFELYRGSYSPGTIENGYGGGIMGNFIISPSLGIETGALFHNTEYSIHSHDISKTALPQPDPNFGEFRSIEVKSWFFEIPVNLKYRYRLDQKHHFLLGGGLSALLYTKQEVEYTYSFEVSNDFSVATETSFREKDLHWNLGWANASIGLSRLLSNNKKLETSLFYKHSLSGLGIEDADAQLIGLRASYQFTLQ